MVIFMDKIYHYKVSERSGHICRIKVGKKNQNNINYSLSKHKT